MVDLVKVRRKAKQKKEEEERGASSAASLPSPEPPRATTVESHHPSSAEASPDDGADRLERFKAQLALGDGMRARQSTGTSRPDRRLLEVLLFSIGGEQYAIPIDEIAEIIEPRDATRVPNAGPGVIGVISMRGTIVTIVDAAKRVGQRKARLGPDARIVVTIRQGELTGFLVDRVSRVVEVDELALERPPVLDQTEQGDVLRGLFRHGEQLSILLDLEKLTT